MEKLLLFILYIIHIGLCILIQMLMQIKKSTFNPVDVEIPSYDLSKRKQEAKHENCPVQLSLKMLVSHLMLLLLLSHFSCVRLCVTPETAAHQAPPSLGFSRQEHWSGLPFPSPMHESEKWKWSRSIMSNPQRPHGLQPSRLLCPWDFPGKSTWVGIYWLDFLKLKSL